MIGQTIVDRYQLEALIGRGGMGTVYRATDLAEKRPVALKVLHYFLDLQTEVALTRFRREFRVLARLDHPHIMRAYDYGTHSGSPFLVLEFLAGHTLTEELAAGPLPRTDLLRIARQICQALVYIHAQSIVHRDLKPGNLMLLSADDALQLKLMDFGLVRQTNLSMQLTQEGMAIGTVAYMAPEQAQGFPVDFRADLYALGTILYEMATGRPPFVHENPAMVLMQQLTASPLSPRELNPDLDEPLARLIMQLLAKEPAERPLRTELVAAQLARLADETAPTPVPVSKRVDLVPRVPLVGREALIGELARRWAAVQAGQGQVVLLSGAAGSGKTRLLTEARLQVHLAEERYLQGHCREQASLPYQPLDEVLAALLHDLPAAVRHTLPADLDQILPGARPATHDDASLDRDPLRTDQSEARLRLFAACWTLLQQTAQSRALMIALEDLQWADPTTLELVGYLASRLEQVRILLVLTCRPEEIEPGAALASLLQNLHRDRLDYSLTVDLLNREQVAYFLQTALGRAQIPAWLVDSFHRTTGGNPLFIEETLKALAAEGQVAQWAHQESSQWASLPSTMLRLPQSVLALAERRLRQLPPIDRPILTAAAVLGPDFSFAVLQDLTELDEDTLLDVIDRLLVARVIEELPLQDGEDRYRFVQEAFRQTLLNSTSRRRLRVLHRRSGEIIQVLYDTSQPRHWPALAYHFAQAGDESHAITYYTRAGDAAARVYANAEAAASYQRALEIVQARLKREAAVEPEQLIYLYTRRGLSLEFDSQYEEAWRNYTEMQRLAHRRDDRRLELAALLAQARVRAIPTPLHDFEQAEALAQHALTLAGTLDDRQAEARALETLLTVCSLTGRVQQAIEYGEQSLQIARKLDLQEQIAYTLTDLDTAYVADGQLKRAQAALSEAAEIWRSLGNSLMLGINLSISAFRYYLASDYDRVRAAAEEAFRLGEASGNPWAQTYSRWSLAMIHMEQGRLAQMVETMEEVIRLGDQAGLIPVQIFSRAELAWTYGAVGAFEQAAELVHLARSRAEESLPDWRLFPIVVMASLHVRQGNLAAAEAALEEARSIPRTEPNSALLADIWSTLNEGELALARQDYPQVISGMDRFVTRLQQMEIRAFVCDGLLLKGRALLAQGRLEEAHMILTEARTALETLGLRFSLWPVLIELSQVEAGRGNHTEAEALRQAARQLVNYIAAHSPPDLRQSFLALPGVRLVLETV